MPSVRGVLQDVPPVTVLVEVDPEDAVGVGHPLLDPPHSHVDQHVQGQVEAEAEVHETDLGRGIKLHLKDSSDYQKLGCYRGF